MTRTLKFLLAAAAGAAAAGGSAHAATESIICRSHPGEAAMADCTLVSPAAPASAVGSGAGSSSPGADTYYVVEPKREADRSRAAPSTREPVVVSPAPGGAATVQTANVSQPPAEPSPFPYPSSVPGERPLIVYVIDRDDVRAASRNPGAAIPAQRLIITQTVPPPID